MTLDEILGRLGALPDKDRNEVKVAALEATKGRYFVPNIGPQTDAYFSGADEVFYGGGAGGGKSALLCGLATEEHKKAIIFRREYPQIKGLVDELRRQIRTRAGYNAQNKLWRLRNGNQLEFGSVQHEYDKEKIPGPRPRPEGLRRDYAFHRVAVSLPDRMESNDRVGAALPGGRDRQSADLGGRRLGHQILGAVAGSDASSSGQARRAALVRRSSTAATKRLIGTIPTRDQEHSFRLGWRTIPIC